MLVAALPGGAVGPQRRELQGVHRYRGGLLLGQPVAELPFGRRGPGLGLLHPHLQAGMDAFRLLVGGQPPAFFRSASTQDNRYDEQGPRAFHHWQF
ncbi:hypothetical protein SAMN00120144_4175 [Hymenobacter roseosalivarius DSM 11622]|uniref:Uncharacterized protein n=1 Tax=Hymenobacter roseosalivarius DSM 11622 TaxID=645990 RepID=A0A1W1VGK1_9BACT|nr:hypothetical protein SAMN00120144_4175 [Hymenobacter roseosalivarius DSM 11622]